MRNASTTLDLAINDLPLQDPPPEAFRRDPGAMLMEEIRGGSEAAFDALFRRYRASVVRVALRFMRSRDLAEEIAQRVFLQLYQARERYEPRAHFMTYLFRVTANTCLNELRRREYSVIIESLDGAAERRARGCLPSAQAIEPFTDPGLRLEGAELAAAVQRVLGQLPSNQRSAFQLAKLDDLPYREVGEALGTSVSSVKSLVFRATRTLRVELGPAFL